MNKFIKLGEQPFSDGYKPKGVTLYLHSMVFHFSFFIEKYHNVKQFSCQGWYSRTYSIMTIILCSEHSGVEKKNDMAKKSYFRNSNKWDSATDILKHDYQSWLLRDRKRKIGKYRFVDIAYNVKVFIFMLYFQQK